MTERKIYHAPLSLDGEIAKYNKQSFACFFLGALCCAGLGLTCHFLMKIPISSNSFIFTMFYPFGFCVVISALFFKKLSNSLQPKLEEKIEKQIPADFGILCAVANTFNDSDIQKIFRSFHRDQLISAFYSGYAIALAFPILIFLGSVVRT